MPSTLRHPRDHSIVLSTRRPPFGAWRLLVDDERLEEQEETGGYRVTLGDGSVSHVELEHRRFDPFPVLVIDGERFPLGRSLGGSGVVASLLPLGAVVLGPFGILAGLIGAALTLRLSRTYAAAPVRLLTGLGFLVATWGGMTWLWRNVGPGKDLKPVAVEWSPLPAVPGFPPGAAARTALARLPDLPAVDTLPAGTDTILPFSIREVEQLRGWILAEQYSEAEAALRRLAQEARADVRRETRWRTAYRMTFQALPDSFTQRLDDWVAISPDAPEPLAARAWNRYWIGYYWRGEGAAPRDAQAAAGLLNALAQGSADAVAALTKDPDLMPAYWMLINTARTEGDQETAAGLLERALRRSPNGFESYYATMIAFYPTWGGSLEQMQALAEAAVRGAGRNPDLRRLGAYPAWKHGDMRVESSGGEGVPDAEEALRTGADPLFYETLGHALWHAGDPAHGLAYVDTALLLDPTYERARETRHKILNAMAYASSGTRAEALGRSRDNEIRTLLELRPLMDP